MIDGCGSATSRPRCARPAPPRASTRRPLPFGAGRRGAKARCTPPKIRVEAQTADGERAGRQRVLQWAGSGGDAEPQSWGALSRRAAGARAAVDAGTAVAVAVDGAGLGQTAAPGRAFTTDLVDGARGAPALAAVQRQAATAALRITGVAGTAGGTFVAVSGRTTMSVAARALGGADLELAAAVSLIARHGLAAALDAGPGCNDHVPVVGHGLRASIAVGEAAVCLVPAAIGNQGNDTMIDSSFRVTLNGVPRALRNKPRRAA